MFPFASTSFITFTLQPRPTPPATAMMLMRGIPSTICACSTLLYSAQTHWAKEREREGWSVLGAVCHKNPGLCNLSTCSAQLWEHAASLHCCTHILACVWSECRLSCGCLLVLTLCPLLNVKIFTLTFWIQSVCHVGNSVWVCWLNFFSHCRNITNQMLCCLGPVSFLRLITKCVLELTERSTSSLDGVHFD